MIRIGFVAASATGHLNPSLTLAAALAEQGHTVVFYTLADGIGKVERMGFEARGYGEVEFSTESIRQAYRQLGELSGIKAVRFTVDLFRRRAAVGIRELPALIANDQLDGLVVDQILVAGAVIARATSLPYVTVSNALPIDRDVAVPPIFTHFGPATDALTRLRNRALYSFANRLWRPVLKEVNQYQSQHKLPHFKRAAQLNSDLAQVVQLPAGLDFPRTKLPDTFHYAGPFHSPSTRASVEFPWDRLDPEPPLIYASMGTLQNQLRHVFEVIAEACETLPVQLVISLGDSAEPGEFANLRGGPITVRYAPQLELLKRASLCITHAGLNTALECLAQGVPMLAIPVTNDQPGVAARIQWREVGRVLRLQRLQVGQVRSAIEALLAEPRFTDNARQLQRDIERSNGPALAAKIVEQAISTGKPVYRAK